MEKLTIKYYKKVQEELKSYNEYIMGFSAEEQAKANEVDKLELNSTMYKIFLKRLILDKKVPFEEVVDRLPDIKLINKDEKTVSCVNYAFDMNETPITYKIVESFILTGKTDNFSEEISYDTSEDKIKVPFTLSELLSTTPYVKKHKK